MTGALNVAGASTLPVRRATLAHAALLASLAWGAMSFGAVYPWGHWPLAMACLLTGGGGLLVGRQPEVPFATRALIVSLGVIGAAGLVQVVPLPLGLHAWLSPSAAAILPQLDISFAAGERSFRELSLVPAATWKALALFGSFAVLMLGVFRLLGLGGARGIAYGVAILAALLALVGIIQKPLYAGAIYGFWEPQQRGDPFGPFVNKNHFAGWMLLALPIVLALLCAGFERAMRGIKPGLRHKLLWLSSPEASRLVLLALAASVMALALVLTMSRSGISAFALALMLTGWFVLRGLKERSRKAAGAGYLALLTFILVAWVGADAIVSRFAQVNWSEFNTRRGVWMEAWGVAARFPLTGAGLNSYDTLGTYHQRPDSRVRFGEAHNDYLQLAAEGGLLLGIPILVCVGIFIRDVRREARRDEPGSTSWWLRRGAITALVAIGLQETVEFSLQMPGNAALFAVVCAFAIHRPPARPAPLGRTTCSGRPPLRVIRRPTAADQVLEI